ncbi:MAG: hypothetical protein JXA62_06505 [Candidatus Aminicenantes bacterium]|nr:hypothetical protein [Candidatus Aminicenantes bacterium]
MRSRRGVWFVAGVLAASTLLGPGMNASPLEWELSLVSRYIWRGFDLNPENRPALQPSVTVPLGGKGLSLNLWGSFSISDRDLDEIDLTLAWDFSVGNRFAGSLGFVQYGWYFSRNFTWREHTSREFFVSLEASRGRLQPSLSLYWDVAGGSGVYALMGISHREELCCGRELELSASLGYNHRQWIDQSGFSDLNFGISLPQRFYRVTVVPSAHLAVILMDAVNPGTDLEIWGGISVTWDH